MSDRVASWQITNFAARLRDAMIKDSWQSEVYALEHPKYGQVQFYLQLYPKGGSNDFESTSQLYVQLISRHSDLELKFECDAWLERFDGRKSEVKTTEIAFDEQTGDGGWQNFLDEQELYVFRESTSVFVSCRLPYKLKKIGIPAPAETSFRWKITNFGDRVQDAAYKTEWRSDEFTVEGCGAAKFVLTLYPKGYRDYHKEFAGLFFRCKKLNGQPPVSIACELWMENVDGKRTHKDTASYTYNEKEGRGCSNYVEQQKLREFGFKSPFFVCCNARTIVQAPLDHYAITFHRSIARTFNSADYSDLDVNAGGQTFKVSKLVLRTQSAIMDKKIADATNNVVELGSVSGPLAEALLRFFYTGEVDGVDSIALDLLELADEFEVAEMGVLCVEAVVRNIRIDNAIRTLRLVATDSRFDAYKRRILEFADANFNEIKKQAEWEEFGCTHPKIVLELLAISHSAS